MSEERKHSNLKAEEEKKKKERKRAEQEKEKKRKLEKEKKEKEDKLKAQQKRSAERKRQEESEAVSICANYILGACLCFYYSTVWCDLFTNNHRWFVLTTEKDQGRC